MPEFDRQQFDKVVEYWSEHDAAIMNQAASYLRACLAEIDRLQEDNERLRTMVDQLAEDVTANVLERERLNADLDRRNGIPLLAESEHRGYRQGLEAAYNAFLHHDIPDAAYQEGLFHEGFLKATKSMAAALRALMDDKRAAEPHLAPPSRQEMADAMKRFAENPETAKQRIERLAASIMEDDLMDAPQETGKEKDDV